MVTSSMGRGLFVRIGVAQYRVQLILLAMLVMGITGSGQRMALRDEILAGRQRPPRSVRDSSRPTFVPQEFRLMIARMPELTTYMPNMRRYLLDYPEVTLPDATSFVYWQETEFGLKPTIRISHLTIREGHEDTAVASEMLYASHYFWTGIERRALVPDPARGTGFWFVTVSRCRSDGLSGFTGMFGRRRVRSEVQDGALAGLRMTKEKLERSR